jgi:hypothetical protein
MSWLNGPKDSRLFAGGSGVGQAAALGKLLG